MTNKEAIEILIIGSADMQTKKHSWNQIMDAIRIAVHTLKKEIPKKVNNLKVHVDRITGDCPSCGHRIQNYGDAEYCHKCGNKLDWADHEEIKK